MDACEAKKEGCAKDTSLSGQIAFLEAVLRRGTGSLRELDADYEEYCENQKIFLNSCKYFDVWSTGCCRTYRTTKQNEQSYGVDETMGV